MARRKSRPAPVCRRASPIGWRSGRFRGSPQQQELPGFVANEDMHRETSRFGGELSFQEIVKGSGFLHIHLPKAVHLAYGAQPFALFHPQKNLARRSIRIAVSATSGGLRVVVIVAPRGL